jgi:hypothetical protein
MEGPESLLELLSVLLQCAVLEALVLSAGQALQLHSCHAVSQQLLAALHNCYMTLGQQPGCLASCEGLLAFYSAVYLGRTGAGQLPPWDEEAAAACAGQTTAAGKAAAAAAATTDEAAAAAGAAAAAVSSADATTAVAQPAAEQQAAAAAAAQGCSFPLFHPLVSLQLFTLADLYAAWLQDLQAAQDGAQRLASSSSAGASTAAAARALLQLLQSQLKLFAPQQSWLARQLRSMAAPAAGSSSSSLAELLQQLVQLCQARACSLYRACAASLAVTHGSEHSLTAMAAERLQDLQAQELQGGAGAAAK